MPYILIQDADPGGLHVVSTHETEHGAAGALRAQLGTAWPDEVLFFDGVYRLQPPHVGNVGRNDFHVEDPDGEVIRRKLL